MDTVFVFESPQVPLIAFDESSNELFLENDSQLVNYQWYFYQSPIFDATSTTHQSNFSGYYSLLATNNFGCAEFSNEELVVICDNNFNPIINIVEDTLSTDQYTYFNYQWFLDNEPISAANSNSHVATLEGAYSLVLSDEWGVSINQMRLIMSTLELMMKFSMICDCTPIQQLASCLFK